MRSIAIVLKIAAFVIAVSSGSVWADTFPDPNDQSRLNDPTWKMHDLGNDTSCLLPDEDGNYTSAKVLYRKALTPSGELLIFVSGGGACNNYDTCVGKDAPKNVKGYSQEDFDNDNKIQQNLYLRTAPPNTSDTRVNPFIDKNMAMIPYCTGDMHSGIQSTVLTKKNKPSKVARFWGHTNFQKAIDYLHGVFPDVTTIYLFGQSAGAGGVVLQYPNVVAKWTSGEKRPQVNLIEDSAPVVVGPVTADANRMAWNPSCDFGRSGGPNCIGAPEMRLENSNLPDNLSYRHAILRFSWDGVLFPISELDTFAKYNTKVSGKNDDFETEPGAKAVVRQLTIMNTKKVDGTAYCPRHVVTNFNVVDFTIKTGTVEQVAQKDDIQEAHYQFISDMVGNTAWTSRSLDLFQPTSSEPEIGCPASQNDLLRTKTRVKNASR